MGYRTKKTKDEIEVPFNIYNPPPEDEDMWGVSVTKMDPLYKTGKVITINLNDPKLLATQKFVSTGTIKKHNSGEWVPKTKFPIIVRTANGNMYIQDGHHRLSQQKISGKKYAKAYVIDKPDDYEYNFESKKHSLEKLFFEETETPKDIIKHLEKRGVDSNRIKAITNVKNNIAVFLPCNLSEGKELEEEYIGSNGGLSYFQLGGSLPDNLYNRDSKGKPTRDPGVPGFIKKHKKRRKKKHSLREMFFVEAARNPSSLPEDVGVSIEPYMGNVVVKYTENSSGVEGYVEMKLAKTGCLGAYIIFQSEATKGYGPLLYDVAIEVAGNHGVTADRDSVSPDASNVWEYYYKNRSDISKKPLDDIENPKTQTKDDDCSFDSSRAGGSISFMSSGDGEEEEVKRPWLNFVYYATAKNNFSMLQKLNKLHIDPSLVKENFERENIIFRNTRLSDIFYEGPIMGVNRYRKDYSKGVEVDLEAINQPFYYATAEEYGSGDYIKSNSGKQLIIAMNSNTARNNSESVESVRVYRVEPIGDINWIEKNDNASLLTAPMLKVIDESQEI